MALEPWVVDKTSGTFHGDVECFRFLFAHAGCPHLCPKKLQVTMKPIMLHFMYYLWLLFPRVWLLCILS